MENLDGLNVLVIGGNGFLGRHLLAGLERGNASVHAVSRKTPSEAGRIRWWQGSATDVHWIRELTARLKPDVIYQLASASLGGQDPGLVLPTFENDLRTTVNALVAAQECGVGRVIITRSLDEPIAGDGMKAPPSPYAAAKAASGLYGRMFEELYGVSVVMLRPFMTYGPGQKAHKIVPYTILSLLKGLPPKLSSGERGVDWVYVQDVISGFIAAATKPEAVGKEIDLGSGTLVSIRDVVAEIESLIPGAPRSDFGSRSDRVNESVRQADLKAAETSLGWRPTTGLREGLSETIDWYRKRVDQFEVVNDSSPRALGAIQ